MSRGKPEGEDGFLARWSRRKAGLEPEPQPVQPAPEAPPPAEDARSDADVLAELGLPEPDTLKAGDDFKAFMRTAVPARIRNRALRALWRSNPKLANLDALLDYGGDFTDKGMRAGVVATAYEVGRGFARKAKEAEQALAQLEGPDEPAAPEPVPARSSSLRLDEPETAAPAALDPGPESAPHPREEVAVELPAEEPGPVYAAAGAAEEPPKPPRRMRFSFDGGGDAA